jgi:hypothetical protein
MSVTGLRWLTAIALGLTCWATPAFAAAFDAKAARQTCTERYEREKEGATLPAGMAKARYVSQCVNSMRRDAELEKKLTVGAAPPVAPAAPAAGSNELPVSGTPTTTKDTRSAKPAAVATPAFQPAKDE